MRSRRPPRQGTTEDWVIASLDANALADHRLDIGAVRAVRAVESAGGSASTTLCRNVIEPRLAPMMDAAVVRPTPTAGRPRLLRPVTAPPASSSTTRPTSRAPRRPCPRPQRRRIGVERRGAALRTASASRSPGRSRADPPRAVPARAVDFDPLWARRPPDPGRRPSAGTADRFALRSSIRVRRAGRLTIVIVDRSDSMSSTLGRAVASIAVGAIEESSRNRSAVAVISARGASADLVVEPTRDVADAHAVISRLPSGGGTPWHRHPARRRSRQRRSRPIDAGRRALRRRNQRAPRAGTRCGRDRARTDRDRAPSPRRGHRSGGAHPHGSFRAAHPRRGPAMVSRLRRRGARHLSLWTPMQRDEIERSACGLSGQCAEERDDLFDQNVEQRVDKTALATVGPALVRDALRLPWGRRHGFGRAVRPCEL